jgi:hypothetical protein
MMPSSSSSVPDSCAYAHSRTSVPGGENVLENADRGWREIDGVRVLGLPRPISGAAFARLLLLL